MSKNIQSRTNAVPNAGKYSDPSNAKSILAQLRTAPTLGHIKNIVDHVFPKWIVTFMDGFCKDYPRFNKNWVSICEDAKVNPTQVMIVEEISQDVKDNSHTLIHNFCECFTRAGFAVKRKLEFIPCANCGCAVPSLPVWNYMKTKGFEAPETWSATCSNC